MPRKKKVPDTIINSVAETFEKVPMQKCREYLEEINQTINFKMNQIGLLFDDLSREDQATLRYEIGSVGRILTDRAIALIIKDIREEQNEPETKDA